MVSFFLIGLGSAVCDGDTGTGLTVGMGDTAWEVCTCCSADVALVLAAAVSSLTLEILCFLEGGSLGFNSESAMIGGKNDQKICKTPDFPLVVSVSGICLMYKAKQVQIET